MKARTRAAFTLVELLTVIAIISLLISILVPALGRAREMGHRAVCSANQAAIMKGMVTYAAGNQGQGPNWGQVFPGFLRVGEGWDWGWDGKTAAGGSVTTGAFTPGPYHNDLAQTGTSVRSNTRNYYLLVRNGLADPKNFICNSDPESPQPFQPADPQKAHDFQSRKQISFSLQYQNPAAGASLDDPRDGWKLNMASDDPKTVVVADKSPFIRPDDAASTPGYFDYEVPATADTDGYGQFLAILKGLETAGNILIGPNGDFQYKLAANDDIQILNSQNHRGEGQNVARLDGSVAFVNTPWQGAAHDNIWTVQDGANGAIDSTVSLTSLVSRVTGAFPGGIQNAQNELQILQQWMAKPPYNRTKYPDSFLVP